MGFIISVVSSLFTVTPYCKVLSQCLMEATVYLLLLLLLLLLGICTSHNATGILHTVHTLESILDECIISHLYMCVMYSLFLYMLLVQFFVDHFGYKDSYSNEYSIYTILTGSVPHIQYVLIFCGHCFCSFIFCSFFIYILLVVFWVEIRIHFHYVFCL